MSVSPARNYVAAMAIPSYQIVKFAADGVVTLATATTDNIIKTKKNVVINSAQAVEYVLAQAKGA